MYTINDIAQTENNALDKEILSCDFITFRFKFKKLAYDFTKRKYF